MPVSFLATTVPSGHALVAFCFYGVFAAIIATEQSHWQSRLVTWGLAVLMVLGIGASRIYLGIHYPSDVIGGYLAALCWVIGVSIVYRRFRKRELVIA